MRFLLLGRIIPMLAYSRRKFLRRASLGASAAVGASLTHTPLLHTGESVDEKLGVAVFGYGGQEKPKLKPGER
jgi:hypothetical protein